MSAIEKLNRLESLQAQADVIRLRFQELREQIMTPEIKAALADVDAEEATTLESLNEGITSLTDEVKQAVLDAGETVKGDNLQAVWVKGRVSWDTKSLDGYAVAHPELLGLRKEGSPSVSIRNVK